MYVYELGKRAAYSAEELPLPSLPPEAPAKSLPPVWLFRRDPLYSRDSFKVSLKEQLFQKEEGAHFLSSRELTRMAEQSAASRGGLPGPLLGALENGTLAAFNWEDPHAREFLLGRDAGRPDAGLLEEKKKRVHVLAIGDVGSNLLTGLHLLGGDMISSIGIADLSDKVTARWEFEENQIAYPWDYDRLPPVDVVEKDRLFDCDVFIFVASVGIPPVGSGVKDPRMAQFETNKKIISQYGKLARKAGYRGFFCCVSDPVDPLAAVLYRSSNENEAGEYDGKGLAPSQIHGFGLGVMNARAAYYAKKEPEFARFLTEGRTFGPHGRDLVVADSVSRYDEEVSLRLTEKVVTANLRMRELGFKPFVAPAFSSGALSILEAMRGNWHLSSVFLGGTFMGCKNRITLQGPETEILPLPDALYRRILHAQEELRLLL